MNAKRLLLLAGIAALLPRPALAWDPATTHAGLTERALSVSKLHATLAHQFGRALGSLEPLHLDMSVVEVNAGRILKYRLEALDPAGGYRPNGEGIAMASAWVQAGAVLAKTPPERGRHHFFEPQKRTGLDDGPGLSGTLHAARLTFDDGATVRDSATGSAFALEGMSALDWLRSPQNDLGLSPFFDYWALAVSAPQANQRETALVRSLLALGGVMSVLEDAGQPAFVRNDFRGEFLAHDAGSEIERFVAEHYGSVSLPAPSAPISRPSLDSFFVAADGNGLAQSTQRRFFSTGTLPNNFHFHTNQSPAAVARDVNLSLKFPEPAVSTLDLRQSGRTRYVVRDGIRILAYQCDGDRVRFFLDQAVYADVARRWLPEVESYAAGLVDYLLRAKLQITVEGNTATMTVNGVMALAAPAATLHAFWEDEAGKRTEFATQLLRQDTPLSFAIPQGARKVAAFVRGQDSSGDFVAAAETRVSH
jgi:hypothetical protein